MVLAMADGGRMRRRVGRANNRAKQDDEDGQPAHGLRGSLLSTIYIPVTPPRLSLPATAPNGLQAATHQATYHILCQRALSFHLTTTTDRTSAVPCNPLAPHIRERLSPLLPDYHHK